MNLYKRWLDRLWGLSSRKGASRVLAGVSFVEAIFFPVPPDLLLIPMTLAKREKALRLAGICLAASLAGGVLGYLIGYLFMESLGWPIINFYGLAEQTGRLGAWYHRYDAWVIALAGLTPIPYKLCTLTAGAFKVNFAVFIIASALSRGTRFFVIAGLAYLFGEKVRFFLEQRFDWVVGGTAVLLVAGFFILKYL